MIAIFSPLPKLSNRARAKVRTKVHQDQLPAAKAGAGGAGAGAGGAMEELMAELETLERSGVEVPADLLAELEKEIARNEEANRIAKQREEEARAAKER